jgi:hypothetical protein
MRTSFYTVGLTAAIALSLGFALGRISSPTIHDEQPSEPSKRGVLPRSSSRAEPHHTNEHHQSSSTSFDSKKTAPFHGPDGTSEPDHGWPEDLTEEFGPEPFKERLAKALFESGLGDVDIEYDCDEFPCLAIAHGKIKPKHSREVMDRLKTYYSAKAGSTFRADFSIGIAGKEHITMYSVFPEEMEDDARLRDDLDRRMQRWQREASEIVTQTDQ